MAGRTSAPKTTVIKDDNLDGPQSTSAGDAPADTHDPKERVSSGRPNKAAAAAAGNQTVNAVEHVSDITAPAAGAPRTETYTAYGPDGETVTVTRDIVTGETTVGEPDPDPEV